jgi:transketolase
VARASRDIVIVEPYLEGTTLPGLAGELGDRPRRYLSIGVPNTELRRYGAAADHDRAHGLDPHGIRRRIEAFLGGTPLAAPGG